MENILNKSSAKALWEKFVEISKIPRESKHEEQIIDYVKNFAKSKNLEHKVDESGNIVIWKNGTAGLSNLPILNLQSHMDMVCEKKRR